MTVAIAEGGWDGLHWDPRLVRVAGFTTAGRRGATSVRVEFVVTSPWELGDLVRHLAELRDRPVPSKATTDG